MARRVSNSVTSDVNTFDVPEKKKRCHVDRPCRVCGKVPEDGYTVSQAMVHDFICLPCRREKKRLRDKDKEEREAFGL